VKDYLADPAFPDAVLAASTPEREGMDAGPLQSMVAAVEARRLPIHALLVIRRGRRVLERYGTDEGRQLTPDDEHMLRSTTKTLCGALVGLAIADGLIASVRARAVDFFEDGEVGQPSAAKDRITIEHLLTMHSGLAYEEGLDENEPVFAEACAGRSFLSRRLVAEPGTRWNYSSADSQILAEIVRRATGKTPLEYARERLLAPLGIGEVRWDADGGGTHFGGTGLFLRPREISRFGWMLSRAGRSSDAQLVPADWVKESTRAHVVATSGWTPGEGYGYHCWIPPFGGFATHGFMGQNMYVFPDRELVVVFTAALVPPETGDALLGDLVRGLLRSV
jgi:CubicO group peptidase (beta-lactamase class C family)